MADRVAGSAEVSCVLIRDNQTTARMRNPTLGRNVMNAIMGLLAVSALAGLVLGFYFELAALAVSGLILSISAAMIL